MWKLKLKTNCLKRKYCLNIKLISQLLGKLFFWVPIEVIKIKDWLLSFVSGALSDCIKDEQDQ